MLDTTYSVNSPRRVAFRFSSAIAGYGLTLVVSQIALRNNPTSPWAPLVALLPMLPIVFVVGAVVSFYRSMDEMQQRVHLEALAVAFPATAFITLAYGLLERVGFPQLSYTFVTPLMATLWGLGLLLSTRRYR